MQNKNFTKANFIVASVIILLGSMFLITACTPSVTPSSPGVATITPTPTATSVPIVNTTLNAGDIAFVGISTTDNQFAFVVTTASGIPAGVQIMFTNYPWDTTIPGFVTSGLTAGGARGAVTFTTPAILPQWSEFAVSNATTPAGVSINQSTGVTVLQTGFTGGFTLNNGEDQIYCYQGSLANPTTIIGATAVYTLSANSEPALWNTGAVPLTAPVTYASATSWAGLPSNLNGGAGTTIAFNGANGSNVKGYFQWTYQCQDTSNTEAGLVSAINATLTSGSVGTSGVTVYAGPVAYTSLGAYTAAPSQNGVSILLGNSEGVSASGGSSGQIIGTANTQIGICNEPHSPKTTGYTTW